MLERRQGMPCGPCIRAGMDGTGTRRAIEGIMNGLRWRAVQEHLICRGEWDPSFLERCEDFGLGMAAGLEAGIF